MKVYRSYLFGGIMRTKEQLAFYGTRAWANCREAYKASVGGLCEECLKNGIVRPGEIVHHKIHVSQDTLKDPNVLLSFENLQLVCRDCHARLHGGKRWKVLPDGTVETR